MGDLNDVGSHLVLSTLFQLQQCLRALDLMGCKSAAAHVDTAIRCMRSDLEEPVQARSLLIRPDIDFGEIDVLVDELFEKGYARSRPGLER